MLPGFQEFYDGMHSHLASEIAHATQDHGDGSLHVPSYLEFAAELFAPCPGFSSLHPAHHDGHGAAHIVGAPHGEGFTHQTTAFTCAVVSQKMILDQFGVRDPRTGEAVSEAHLAYTGAVNGWLTDHGTSIPNMGKLLEHHGVACHHGTGWHHLVDELAHGHQVMVAVNADELWSDHGPFAALSHLFSNAPNHALVLKGLKVDEHRHVTVVVNDPGQAHGAGVEYSLNQFEHALNGANFHYVATDHAPHGWHADAHLTDAIFAPAAHHDAAHFSFADALAALNHLPAPPEIYDFAAALDRMDTDQKHDFLRSL